MNTFTRKNNKEIIAGESNLYAVFSENGKPVKILNVYFDDEMNPISAEIKYNSSYLNNYESVDLSSLIFSADKMSVNF